MPLPYLKLEMDLTGTKPVTWTDYSSYLRVSDGVTTTRGRQDERSEVGAGTASFNLNNDAGTFTNMPLRAPVRLSWSSNGSSWVTMWTGTVATRRRAWTNGRRPMVSVTATDAVTLLSIRKLKTWATEEIRLDSPSWHYPLGDLPGSSKGYDATGVAGRTPMTMSQRGTGGALDFGSSYYPGYDGSTSAAFTPSASTPESNGWCLQTSTPNDKLSDFYSTGATFECFFRTSALTAPAYEQTVLVSTADSWSNWDARALVIRATTGKLSYTGTTILGSVSRNIETAGSVCDGQWHHVALVASWSAGTVTWTMYLDGSSVGTYAEAGPYGGMWNLGGMVSVGGCPTDYPHYSFNTFSGNISHVAGYSTALSSTRISAHSATRTGFTGERSDQRFDRISSYVGYTAYTPTNGSATMGPQPIFGVGAWEALTACGATEVGSAYISAAGDPALSVRATRFNGGVAITLSPWDISSDTDFALDDTMVLNDVTVSRPYGAGVRYVDSSSVASIGTQDAELVLYLDTDTQVESTAQWLATNSRPAERIGALRVDCTAKASTVSNTTMASLDVGSVVRTVDPKDAVYSGTAYVSGTYVYLNVEGLADRWDSNGWARILNVSPNAGKTVWALGDSVYGLLGQTTTLSF